MKFSDRMCSLSPMDFRLHIRSNGWCFGEGWSPSVLKLMCFLIGVLSIVGSSCRGY